jgi:Flp pilus assembly protein TadD
MKVRLTVTVLTASLLLASCAQMQTKPAAMNIQPLQEVRHGYEQAKAQYELGRYYHGQLRYGLAVESYRRALAMNPAMVDAMNAMGATYAESGNLALAREQFEAALKLQPDSVYTYNNLGYVHYLAGDYPAAVQAYKQALRLDGRHEKARHNLLLALGKMGAGDQVSLATSQESIIGANPPAESTPQKGTQSAWVKLSPAIYEMRSAVAPAEKNATTPSMKGVDTMLQTGLAKLNAAPVTNSPAAVSARAPVAAPRREEQPPVMIAVKAVPYATTVAQKLKAVGATNVRGVEVSNGNGVRGMAAMVARYFSGMGIQQARLTNQKPFVERHTRIEYRPGNAAEAARINSLLRTAAPQVVSNKLRQGIRVRLVLGHDLGHDITAWDNQPESRLVTAGLTGMDLPRY